MPIEEHPAFAQPEDSVLLWRYMDLPKFARLLTTRSLWFSRADLLGDSHEGSHTAATPRVRWARRAGESEDEAAERGTALRLMFRAMTYVSCWHGSAAESTAMWHQYSDTFGVAILTTVGRLVHTLDSQAHDIYLGRIEYVDYDSYVMDPHNSFNAFGYKRAAFSHEQEVRAVFLFDEGKDESTPGEGRWVRPEDQRPGHELLIDLEALFTEVRVSPRAPDWYVETVERLMRIVGLDVPVVTSELARPPIF